MNFLDKIYSFFCFSFNENKLRYLTPSRKGAEKGFFKTVIFLSFQLKSRLFDNLFSKKLGDFASLRLGVKYFLFWKVL